MATTTASLRDALVDFLAPLREAASDSRVLASWLAAIGQTAAISGDPALADIVRRADTLAGELTALDAGALESWQGVTTLLDTARQLAAVRQDLETFANAPARAAAAAGLAEEVMALLLASYLRRRRPRLFRVASLLTIVEPRELGPVDPAVTQDGTTLRHQRILDRFGFQTIADLLDKPGQVLSAAYFPNALVGAPDAWSAAARLFPQLAFLAELLDLSWRIEYRSTTEPPPPATDKDPDTALGEIVFFVDDERPLSQVPPVPDGYFGGYLPVFRIDLAADAEADALAVEIAASSAAHPTAVGGLVISVVGNLDRDETRGQWRLTFSSTGSVPALALGPHGVSLADADAGATGSATLVVQRVPDADATGPALVVGSASGTRLELGGLRLTTGVAYDHGTTSASIGAAATSCALIVSGGDGDSLMADVFPNQPVQANGDLSIVWSTKTGLTLGASAGLDETIPVAVSVGPVTVLSIRLALRGTADGIDAEASVGANAALGPLRLSVDGIGVAAVLGFSAGGGNLGLADLSLGFKPPSGMGVVLDAGVATGGGYLAFDPAKAEYAGALDVSLLGIAVKGYGLVQTKLPGGLAGYSFVVVVSTEFSPPVQLPFGFSLDGVGGLLGLQRTVAEDAVRAAVWAHKLDGLLFPHDPVAAAPQLVSALDTYFPAAPGRFLVGPLAEIGWGEGIVEGQVALLVELPEPLKLLLIGDVNVRVPSLDPVLVLHISFDGGVDVKQRLAFFDASLHDSKIDSYPLTGDLAFRYAWSDPGVFALAIGGFNPHYQPPASFPTLKRLAIAISSSVAQVTAQGYLALTSNTLQFGARVELTAGTGSFNVHGFLGFDALCEWSPFAFAFDLSAGVDLRAGSSVIASVHLSGQLSGPTPWHIKGQASISLFFFDISVHFDRTWGNATPALPAPDVAALVRAALTNQAGWSGLLPPTAHTVVSFSGAPSDSSAAVLLDPAASLQVRQRLAPLDQPITRFAGTPLGQPVQLSIDNLTIFDTPIANADETSDEFAPGQFLDLSDADKLSLPSFSRFPSGIQAGRHSYDLGSSNRARAQQAQLSYDTSILDTETTPRPGATYTPTISGVLAMNETTQPTPAGLTRYAPAPNIRPAITLAPETWTIASTTTLQPPAGTPTTTNKLIAQQILRAYVVQHPDQSDQLQTVPTSETA